MKYANLHGYSDVYPHEIIRHVSKKTIEIREMGCKKTDWKPKFVQGGFSAMCTNQNEQTWHITSEIVNPTKRIRLHADGAWRDTHGQRFRLADEPIRFYDYNF